MSSTPNGAPADATTDTPRTDVGRLVRALGWGGRIRVLAAVIDGPARETCRRHSLRGGAALLASEGLVATALLASQIKGAETLVAQVQSQDPRFSFAAEMRDEGLIRARFSPTALSSRHVFQGYLLTIKHLEGRELYRGITEVRTEGFGAALERQVRESAQTSGRVRIFASLNGKDVPIFAAGLLLEPLPGLEPGEFDDLVDPILDGDFRALMTAFAFGQLGGEPVEVLEARDIVFSCTCSRDRVMSTLRALGPDDLEDLLAEQGQAEATCHFCCEQYVLDATQLRALIHELREGPQA